MRFNPKVTLSAIILTLSGLVPVAASAQSFDLEAVPRDQWGEERGDRNHHVWTHPKGDVSLNTPPDWTWSFVSPKETPLSLLQVFSPKNGGPARACTFMREKLAEGQGTYNSFAAAQTALTGLVDDYADEFTLTAKDIFPEPETKITVTHKGLKTLPTRSVKNTRAVTSVAVDLSISLGSDNFLMRGIGIDLPDATFVSLVCMVGPDDQKWLETLPSMMRINAAALTSADH